MCGCLLEDVPLCCLKAVLQCGNCLLWPDPDVLDFRLRLFHPGSIPGGEVTARCSELPTWAREAALCESLMFAYTRSNVLLPLFAKFTS